MMKNIQLNKWMWKWHFIGGLISIPIIILLSVTGTIYLFKDNVEISEFKPLKKVEVKGERLSYQRQWDIAKAYAVKAPTKLIISKNKEEATEFISGKHGGKSTLFVNPYTAKVTGEVVLKDTWMYTIRKLHGELLLGGFGTKFVELVGCWMLVLIITGVYIWWPKKKWKLGGFFTVRTKVKKRLVWRDLHAVLSFWLSILLLITLAGGLPWTDVWGGIYKKIQNYTNTGFPITWSNKSIKIDVAKTSPKTLDYMVEKAKILNLDGKISIALPQRKNSVYTISNRAVDLYSQKVYHFNQYTGEEVKSHTWSDVGILMKTRMWVMRFHEGYLGSWNWWLMLLMSILFTISSIASVFAYVLRKRKNNWGIPKVPAQFQIGKAVLILLVLLSILFPLFGLSVLLIIIYEKIKR
ncbi:PepSY domain-containing protein [Tenacibaculum finnmarkense genomovar ulcerans]|nr:PepSY domain-containing protein [Tenacibaculum finnmarkense genomovar ulcerans]